MAKPEVKRQSDARKKPDAPLSETIIPKLKDGNAEQVTADLVAIAKAYPEKVISRNYYRVHGRYAESVWNQHFGTFHEFKRQSGIVLSRQAHHLERQIAKHASVDHYREFNTERQQYSEKYIRRNKGRYKLVMVASDLHDHECDPFFLKVFLDTAKRVQPDLVILNGDIFDLPEFGRYDVDPRQWDPTGRIRFVHEKILGPLREACPDTQIDFIEGNHEYRLLRHLCDATPAMKAVLSDLHGFTVPKLLGIDKFELNYVAKADLAAYTLSNVKEEIGRNYKVYYGCLLAHHFPEGARLGIPGINGHEHRWNVRHMHNETFGSYQWVQGGCGHIRDATYTNGEKWTLNFNMAHVDTQERLVNWECVSVTDFAVVGGRYYYRNATK
jgi:hypothetical protein